MANAKKNQGEPAPTFREQIPRPVWGRSWGVLGLGFVLFLAVWCQPVWCQRPATLPAGNLAEFVPGQIVVLFRKGVPEDRIHDINETQGTTVLKVVPNLKIYLLRLRKGVSPPEAARKYRKFPEVLAADPNFVVRAVVSDPEFNQQWYFANNGNNPGNQSDNLGFIDADIDAPKGWLVNMGAPNIKIAILDSGIDTAPLPTHPDLTNKVVASANFTSSSSWADVYDHGTHVAGLAAAWINGQFIHGTCPLCSLINAKVIDDNNVGNLFALQQGISWAVAAGANILNASLSGQGSCPTTLQPVIDWAVLTHGRIFVAAAGNSGSNLNSSPAWPAVCSNVVTVAATDARDAGRCSRRP